MVFIYPRARYRDRRSDENGYRLQEDVMSARCQVTGATPGFGNNVSHSARKTRRRWAPNIQRRRYWVPSLGRQVRLDVSARGIKTIDKRGIDAVVAELIARGEKV
jgi:large subunit ribosomal protein L28